MQNRHPMPANRVVMYLHSPAALESLPACLPSLTALNLSAFHCGFRRGFPYIHLNDLEPDDPAYDRTWALMQQAQRAGVRVHAVLGGARAAYTTLFEDYETFYPLWRALLREFRFDGVDLGIEEVVAQDDVERLIDDLRRDFPPGFQITAAPLARALRQGYDPVSRLVWRPLAERLDWLNVQFHGGFGSLANCRDYDAIVQAGYDPAQLVGGILGNPARGSGYVPVATVCATLRTLAARYDGRAGGVAGCAEAHGPCEQVDPAA
uniref:glycosyl hydrolase family 18 protein n=1 Tax=Janthinobacterium sp. TaxID=1871054 RepID=UPI00293D4BCB